MPFDPTWLLAIPGIINLIGGLFGGGGGTQQQQQETITEQEPGGYQSPLVGLLDPWMMENLLGRYGLLAGAGMPGGQGGLSASTQEIMRLLGEQWPELLAGYRGAGRREGGRISSLLRQPVQREKLPKLGGRF